MVAARLHESAALAVLEAVIALTMWTIALKLIMGL
jgi:arginine exporter protein ArgO